MKTKILHISKDIEGGIGTVIKVLLNSFRKSKNIFIKDGYKSFFKLFKNKYYKYEILHFHGAWTLHILPLVKKTNKPTLISPHGAFHQVSLQKSKFKKIVAKYLYMKRCYQNTDCIHALTLKEAKDIRSYGINKPPIAIIPNGIDLNDKLEFNEKLKKELLDKANGKKIILSLSRLHISKGIDILIDAFAKVYKSNNDIVLFIVGKGDDKYTNSLVSKIKNLSLSKSIFLLGDMNGKDKNTVYDVADIFVLPSYNEGFPLTVLEAYRQNTPVITTTATPFEQIETLECGWYVDPTVNEIFTSLKEATKLNKDELKVMGKKGYHFVDDNYSIDMLIAKYKELYLWLLNGGNMPKFVKEQ